MVVATEQLEILRGAGAFVFWPEGFMGRVGPELAAFRALQPLASSVALEVQASFAQATPAGRIYLCCLLNDADATLGGAAWSDLSASTSQVIVSPGGCTPRISTELGLFAHDALEHGVSAALQRALTRYVALYARRD